MLLVSMSLSLEELLSSNNGAPADKYCGKFKRCESVCAFNAEEVWKPLS